VEKLASVVAMTKTHCLDIQFMVHVCTSNTTCRATNQDG